GRPRHAGVQRGGNREGSTAGAHRTRPAASTRCAAGHAGVRSHRRPRGFHQPGRAIPGSRRDRRCACSPVPQSLALPEILIKSMRRCFLHRGIGHGTVVSVRITVLGCSGSVVGPDSPASGYLLRAPDTPPLVIDFGGGVLGALQRYADPASVHVLLSHLHADHCLDMPGLFVWRRYHPSSRPQGKAMLYGPSDTWSRLGAASSPYAGGIPTPSHIFAVHPWVDAESVEVGALTVTPRVVAHPTESYGLRITDPSGASFVYSGDTGVCDQLVELARDADVFLCEASWTHAPDRPPALHLSG